MNVQVPMVDVKKSAPTSMAHFVAPVELVTDLTPMEELVMVTSFQHNYSVYNC